MTYQTRVILVLARGQHLAEDASGHVNTSLDSRIRTHRDESIGFVMVSTPRSAPIMIVFRQHVR